MKKGKSIAILAIVVVVLGLLTYYATLIVNDTQTKLQDFKQSPDMTISLGLDLAGGGSVTYEIKDENPSDEDISDTVYKLQKRIESKSTEASVYRSGDRRIIVEIPGLTDINEIQEELGKPGTLSFLDPEGNEFMTGADVVDAKAGTYKDKIGNMSICVDLILSDEAAEKFSEVTGENIGKNLPIVYDGEVISNPVVQGQISGGTAQITGMADFQEAENLASYIRIGSLSLELEELEAQVVGAQLGSNALQNALIAAGIGLLLIAIFMCAYYRMAGVAATIALAIYSTLVMAVIYWFRADITLTLPGIAGIILGIGMAVDANVVIYGRIREEISSGKSVYNAVRDGFKKATPAILDGNITTLIAAIVLAFFGSGTVKGFAYTLAVGIIVSLVTSLLITRYVMYAFVGLGADKPGFYGTIKERKPWGFMKKRVIFYIIGIVFALSGFVGMGINSAAGNSPLNLSLEFVGGSATTVVFDKDYELAEIEKDMVPMVQEFTGSNDVSVQKVQGSNGVVFKTRNLNLEEREAFNQMFVDKYGVDETLISSQTISSTISGEMTRDAIIAVIISVILMMIYIVIRFRDIRFATAAVIALLHDVACVFAAFSLLRISVGSTFIAVMLTILGYSINDTIVVFDRVRENLRGRVGLSKAELIEVADASVTQTIVRSINTSVTTFVMVLLLYILGAATIKDFSLPLMVGIVAGLFSSVCISTALWYGMKVRSKAVRMVEDKNSKKAGKKNK